MSFCFRLLEGFLAICSSVLGPRVLVFMVLLHHKLITKPNERPGSLCAIRQKLDRLAIIMDWQFASQR